MDVISTSSAGCPFRFVIGIAAAENKDAELTASDQFGQRFMIAFEATGPKGTGVVRSFWILRNGEDTPRLTSCYVK